MPVDTGIYANLLRAPKSIADYDAEAQATQGNALASQLRRQQIEGNALSMRQAQQKQLEADADTNALRTLAGGWNSQTTADQRIAGLRNSGRPALMGQADTLEKQYIERTKAKSEIAGRDVETENKVVTMWRDMIGNAAGPEQAAQMVAAMHADPRIAATPIAKVPLDMALQKLQQTPFDQWRQQFALGAAKFVEMNKPTYQQQNLGGTMQTMALPGLVGAPSVVSSAPITQSADNRATVGASMANAAATRAAAKTLGDATRAAASAQRDQATEMKLADDYRQQSKDFKESKSAHEQLSATLKSSTTSPAATLAAATKFMKILDPGSVVRESELGMALAASGVLDRAANYVSTLQSGKKLTPTQAADFKMVSDQMYAAAQKVQRVIDADYQSKAKQYGLRPEMVTQDLGQNSGTVPPAVAAALAKHGGK